MLLRALKPYLFFSGALFKKLVNFWSHNTQCFKRGGKNGCLSNSICKWGETIKRRKHGFQNTSCIVLDILTSGRKTKQNKKQKKQLFGLRSPPEKGDKRGFCEFNLLRKYMDCGLTREEEEGLLKPCPWGALGIILSHRGPLSHQVYIAYEVAQVCQHFSKTSPNFLGKKAEAVILGEVEQAEESGQREGSGMVQAGKTASVKGEHHGSLASESPVKAHCWPQGLQFRGFGTQSLNLQSPKWHRRR